MPPPTLLALKGPPGSGKTTLARALSRTLHWPLIDKDDIRDLTDNEPPGLSYNVMLNIGRRQLLQGLSVICDSPLGYRTTYESAARIAAETGATLAIVECHCPDPALWRSRIASRQTLTLPAHATTTWAAVEAFQQRTAAAGHFTITHPHLLADTTQPSPPSATKSSSGSPSNKTKQKPPPNQPPSQAATPTDHKDAAPLSPIALLVTRYSLLVTRPFVVRTSYFVVRA